MRRLALAVLLPLAACASEPDPNAVADATSTVTVAYEGRLADGTVFDEAEETTFSLSRTIPGFRHGIAGMRAGETKTLVVPPDAGYGPFPPPGSGISPTDTLTFEVTLLGVR